MMRERANHGKLFVVTLQVHDERLITLHIYKMDKMDAFTISKVEQNFCKFTIKDLKR